MTQVLAAGEAVWAAVGHGHFGVKLHRSKDGGATFNEIPAPKYPPQPEGHVEKDQMGREIKWNLEMLWSLEGAGGTLWAGTLPGGLFKSTDMGETWTLNRPLWDRAERRQWMGGGYDYPGLHSIGLGKGVTVGVSTWDT